jgi:diacylglycerol kinase family enzyme
LHPTYGAVHNDGLFDVVMYTRPGRWSLVRYAVAAFRRRTDGRTDVTKARAAKVTLSSSSPVAIQLDGDPEGRLPRTLEVLREEATVIVP